MAAQGLLRLPGTRAARGGARAARGGREAAAAEGVPPLLLMGAPLNGVFIVRAPLNGIFLNARTIKWCFL